MVSKLIFTKQYEDLPSSHLKSFFWIPAHVIDMTEVGGSSDVLLGQFLLLVFLVFLWFLHGVTSSRNVDADWLSSWSRAYIMSDIIKCRLLKQDLWFLLGIWLIGKNQYLLHSIIFKCENITPITQFLLQNIFLLGKLVDHIESDVLSTIWHY